MRHENVTSDKPGFDVKAAGYILSIVSVLLIGIVAWPKPGEPEWMRLVLIGGMATSIIGMGLRYIAHLKEKAEIRRAKNS